MKKGLLIALSFILTITAFSTLQAQTADNGFTFTVTSPESIAGIYSYGGTSDFGPAITENFCGNLIWAGEPENLACEPINADLAGNIALIRRGTCDFSLKIYHAQEAGATAVIVVGHDQDPDGLDAIVGMRGGDSASVVTIPAIFISYTSGESIVPAVNEGDVEVCFSLPTFGNALGVYAYSTPQSQIIPLTDLQVTVTNREDEIQNDITCTLEIADPLGEITTLSKTRNLAANDTTIYNFQPYVPVEMGEYNMLFTSGYDGSTIERKFEITEFTFALDNGEVSNAVGPSDDLFQTSEFFYQHANLYFTGADAVATHLTFGLGNGAELLTGDASSDVILYAIYNGDSDGDNSIDQFEDFEELGDPISVGLYEITGEETFEELITIPLEDPLMMEEGEVYFISIAYDGIGAGTGVAPSFSVSSVVDYFAYFSPLQLDRVYNGGWANFTPITRLHLEGFISNVNEIELLPAESLTILENPAKDRLQYRLNLENAADDIKIILRSVDGSLISMDRFQKTNYIEEEIKTTALPAGTYFLNVIADDKFRSEKIIIVD